jgi:hypothetical protein
MSKNECEFTPFGNPVNRKNRAISSTKSETYGTFTGRCSKPVQAVTKAQWPCEWLLLFKRFGIVQIPPETRFHAPSRVLQSRATPPNSACGTGATTFPRTNGESLRSVITHSCALTNRVISSGSIARVPLHWGQNPRQVVPGEE